MPSGVSGLIGGLQGGRQQANPYAGIPGLNQQQAANIMQQLRSGMGIGGGAPAGGTIGGTIGALPAGANPQAALQQMVGAAPQNSMTALPAGAAYQGMPNTMQGFNGFAGMAPLQANAYTQSPQQTALQSMARGLGGRSPMQPGAYAQNPYAFIGG